MGSFQIGLAGTDCRHPTRPQLSAFYTHPSGVTGENWLADLHILGREVELLDPPGARHKTYLCTPETQAMHRLYIFTAIALVFSSVGCSRNRTCARAPACNPCGSAPLYDGGMSGMQGMSGMSGMPSMPPGVQVTPGQIITPGPEVYTPAPQ